MVRFILVILILVSQPLSADPFPNSNGKADNKVHFVCWDQPGEAPSELIDHLNYMNTVVYNNSGLYAYPYYCTALVDAIYSDLLVSNQLGVRICNNKVGDVCIESDVLINKQKINAEAANHSMTPTAVKRKVWCHESGHSYGLAHSSLNSTNCMVQGFSTHWWHSTHQMISHLANL